MPFIDKVLKYKSISVVGMEKNTGKTECLNYIIRRLKTFPIQTALTSIGIDGEQKDQVTQTHKPEIEVFENMIFATSEKHYTERKVISEIIALSKQQTALGRLVIARAKSAGKLLLSGPSTTIWMESLIKEFQSFSVDITLIDGALSRMSLASPTITEGMILCTGAALSINIQQIVKRTAFIYKLICLEEVDNLLGEKLNKIEHGIWAVDEDNNLHNLEISSVFTMHQSKKDLLLYGTTIFVSGAVSDNFLKFLRMQKEINEIVLIVRDFTKIFISEENYLAFIRKGGVIKVLQKTNLVAICVNPVSPTDITLSSKELCNAIQRTVAIPVYDIRLLPEKESL